jgi:hypothetical protein
MEKFACYIPFFVGRKDAFDELGKTLKSLIIFSKNLQSIQVIFCQKEYENSFKKEGDLIEEMGVSFQSRFVSLRKPILLPIATYKLMQEEGMAHDRCLYTESDHIFQIKEGFLQHVIREVDMGNVVMPHRLGKNPFWRITEKKYISWNDYYVGNYISTDYHAYSDFFDSVTGNYSAYAGAYFASRAVVRKYKLSFPWSANLVWRGMCEYARKFSGGMIFGLQAPYGLLLEAPSLVFESRGQHVLKPHLVEDMSIIHLSKNGVV